MLHKIYILGHDIFGTGEDSYDCDSSCWMPFAGVGTELWRYISILSGNFAELHPSDLI